MTFQSLTLPIALSLATAFTALPGTTPAETASDVRAAVEGWTAQARTEAPLAVERGLEALADRLPALERPDLPTERETRSPTTKRTKPGAPDRPEAPDRPDAEDRDEDEDRDAIEDRDDDRDDDEDRDEAGDSDAFGKWVSSQARSGVTGRELAEAIRAEKARRGHPGAKGDRRGPPEHAGPGKGKGKGSDRSGR